MNFLINYWILFAFFFYWGFLHLHSLRRLTCNSFLICLVWFWDECNTGFIKGIRQCSFLFYFMEKIMQCWYCSSLMVWYNLA
jgi:hypothetical protein